MRRGRAVQIKCLQRPPEPGVWQVGFSQVWQQTVPNSWGSICESPVPEAAGCSVDSQRPRVSVTHLRERR